MTFPSLTNKQLIENHLYNFSSMQYRMPMPNYSHPCFMQDNVDRMPIPPPPHMIPASYGNGNSFPNMSTGFDFSRVQMQNQNQMQFPYLSPDYLRQMGLPNLTYTEVRPNSSNGQVNNFLPLNPFQQFDGYYMPFRNTLNPPGNVIVLDSE